MLSNIRLLKGAIHALQTGDDEGNTSPFPYVSEKEMMQVIEQYTISSSAPTAQLNTPIGVFGREPREKRFEGL